MQSLIGKYKILFHQHVKSEMLLDFYLCLEILLPLLFLSEIGCEWPQVLVGKNLVLVKPILKKSYSFTAHPVRKECNHFHFMVYE